MACHGPSAVQTISCLKVLTNAGIYRPGTVPIRHGPVVVARTLRLSCLEEPEQLPLTENESDDDCGYECCSEANTAHP